MELPLSLVASLLGRLLHGQNDTLQPQDNRVRYPNGVDGVQKESHGPVTSAMK